MKNELVNIIEAFSNDMGLGEKEVKELYRSYVDEMYEELGGLEDELKNNRIENCGKYIHNIKGISSNYRVSAVYYAAAKLDQIFKNKKYDLFISEIDEVFSAAKEALDLLEEYLSY